MARFHPRWRIGFLVLFGIAAASWWREQGHSHLVGELRRAPEFPRAVLLQPVRLDFKDATLEEVLVGIGRQAGLPIILDHEGLAQEGVFRTTPVSLSLSQPLRTKSAIRLILEPLHLDYCVRHGYVVITSEQHVERVTAQGIIRRQLISLGVGANDRERVINFIMTVIHDGWDQNSEQDVYERAEELMDRVELAASRQGKHFRLATFDEFVEFMVRAIAQTR